jgi:fructokinase
MAQVWVAGEVLIDLIPNGNRSKPIVGGGPANTAKALARVGVDTQFIDGISTDDYGLMIKDDLLTSGIKLDYVKYSDLPTCLAKVSLNEKGSASYEFVIEGTATFDFNQQWLPNPAQLKPSLLYTGTLATIIEPGATELFTWAQSIAKSAPIVFDPNIRDAVMKDRNRYVSQVERWVAISSVVKVSQEDLTWLYPSLEIDQIVNNWLTLGALLVVVTFGDQGLAAYGSGEKIKVDAINVEVVDTVGAGDTVGAILVEAIVKDGLASLSGRRLEMMLKRAAKAAAITVSRAGANPPTSEEIG